MSSPLDDIVMRSLIGDDLAEELAWSAAHEAEVAAIESEESRARRYALLEATARAALDGTNWEYHPDDARHQVLRNAATRVTTCTTFGGYQRWHDWRWDGAAWVAEDA